MTTLDGPSFPGDTHRYALWDAAYVLGSLSCAERREFEAHIRDCPSCADAVSEIGGITALLSQVDCGHIATLDVSDGKVRLPPLRNALVAKANTRRRRARAATWTLSVAATVSIGIFIAVQANPPAGTRPPPPQGSALELAPRKPVALAATVILTRRAWGTRIDMQCTYEAGPMDVDYGGGHASDELAEVAVGRDGSRTQLATWTARVGMPTFLGGSTALPVDEIASVQIVSADTGAVLLERDL